MGGGNGMLARGIESAAWRPARGEVMRRFGCALGVTCGGGIGSGWATILELTCFRSTLRRQRGSDRWQAGQGPDSAYSITDGDAALPTFFAQSLSFDRITWAGATILFACCGTITGYSGNSICLYSFQIPN